MTAEREPQFLHEGGNARLQLTLATSDYDHVRDLTNGVVRAEGIALNAFVLPIEEIFYRFIHHQEWDVSEVSFAKYIALTSQGAAPMVGIPVFPSRVFRHSAIYVRTDRNIRTPKDLEGCVVGIPEWAQTAGIYARGILAESYSVDLRNIRWVQAGMNQAGRAEKVALNLPAGIRYETRPDASLSELLLKGDLDAVITARVPDAFVHGAGRVARMFPDYRGEEAAFHARTGIFPIMHVIALRRAVFERHPWAAMNLFKAFEEAKLRSLDRVADITASRIPMPWTSALSAEFAGAFGADPFPYGIDANCTTLDAFCRFAHDQGITPRLMKPEDLFPAEVHKTARV
jgi:4,5-dihydroxyphthalate decarboxylase